MYRLDPAVALETIRDDQVTFTVGSITVFIALMNAPTASRAALATLTKIYSGGRRSRRHHRGVPGHVRAVHPQHLRADRDHLAVACCSAGRQRAGRRSLRRAVGRGAGLQHGRAHRRRGRPGPPAGEIGELVTAGPQVVPGYWNKPGETARRCREAGCTPATSGTWTRGGWFFIVDRKKDQINVSGYKVWPREVEDVLYEHEAVREAAVVGVPDPYRGETVKAYVSLKPGARPRPRNSWPTASRSWRPTIPRQVEIIDELPKTVTGKILRRELRGR